MMDSIRRRAITKMDSPEYQDKGLFFGEKSGTASTSHERKLCNTIAEKK
jgi:hypothetical protein